MYQNEVIDILKDEMSMITGEEDDEEEGDPGIQNKFKENTLTEYQSFTDLTYSKSKVISTVQWLPHKKV